MMCIDIYSSFRFCQQINTVDIFYFLIFVFPFIFDQVKFYPFYECIATQGQPLHQAAPKVVSFIFLPSPFDNLSH